MTLSKENLQFIEDYDTVEPGEAAAMARELLALRERAEPVDLTSMLEGMDVSVDVSTCDADAGNRYFGTVTEVTELDTAKNGLILLVKDAEPNFKQPAPMVVPDERYQQLSELYHAQEKRLFKLAQRIKGPAFDEYAHSPSQAIDVLEVAIFGENEEACRAAMLQGAEPVSLPYKLPDGWIKCSERLPNHEQQVWAHFKFDDGTPATGFAIWDDEEKDWYFELDECGDLIARGKLIKNPDICVANITHWMPLPAAPGREG